MDALKSSSSADSSSSDPGSLQEDMHPTGVRRSIFDKFSKRGKEQMALEKKNREAALKKQSEEWENVKVAGRKTRRRGKKVKKAHRKTKSRRAH
jgi:hypothetical protein